MVFREMSTVKLLLLFLTFGVVGAEVLMCYAKVGNPVPELIDPFLCTHLLIIGNSTFNAGGLGFPETKMLERYNNMKLVNPNLKILLSLTPKNKYMSMVVVNQTWTESMAREVRDFLIQNNLDGYDFDWEFPVWSPDSKFTDRDGFTQLLKTFRYVFDASGRRLLMTAAVVAMYNIADLGYDAQGLNKYLDYVQVMNYDFHMYSVWRPFTGFNAPLHKEPFEQWFFGYVNSEYSTQHWLDLGISPDKLIFGIPAYGVGYELLDKNINGVYSPAVNVSKYGSVIGYRRSCNYLKMKKFKYHWDKYAATPYIVNGKQWLAIEDKRSVRAKARFARSLNLGGIMVFALDSDDYEGKCGEGAYPLIHAIKERSISLEFVKIADKIDKWVFDKLRKQRKILATTV